MWSSDPANCPVKYAEADSNGFDMSITYLDVTLSGPNTGVFTYSRDMTDTAHPTLTASETVFVKAYIQYGDPASY